MPASTVPGVDETILLPDLFTRRGAGAEDKNRKEKGSEKKRGQEKRKGVKYHFDALASVNPLPSNAQPS